jgi:hypothetical protein
MKLMEDRARSAPGYRAFRLLQAVFTVLPIVAGTDKFFHVLVNWNQYLSPAALRILGSHATVAMRIAGAFEILFGIGMIFRPSVFSYLISAWLLGIVLNLLMTGAYYDIALRDFALVLATFALGNLSEAFQAKPVSAEGQESELKPPPRRAA